MEQLRDIYGFDHVPFFKTGTFLTLLIGSICLVLLLIGIVIYYVWLGQKNNMPYWQEALNSLERIKAASNMSAVHKEQFFMVSHIIKNYCSIRYHQYLDAQTDKEFIHSVKKLMEPSVHSDVTSIFTDATQVKYAGSKSQQALLRELIKKAEHVIECTREKEESNKQNLN